jgi:starch-binding outer membrane protein, SusD/RagB family
MTDKNILQQIKIIFILISFCTGCTKLVEVDAPVNTINKDNVYSTDATAASVLTGLYTKMSRQNIEEFDGAANIATIYTAPGLSSDELTLFDRTNTLFFYNLFYNNELTSTDAPAYWNSIYPDIYIANAAIEGLMASTTLTSSVKSQLIGEAKFMRAFYYFYLVNFYGDVPLVLSTDYKVNRQLGREDKIKVYQQIILDLNDAVALLNEKYMAADLITKVEERFRPNKGTANALLARVHLYYANLGENASWAKAEAAATELISNSMIYDTVTLNNVFLRSNKEAIWQLQPIKMGIDANTGEGKYFVLSEDGPGNTYPVYLSDELMSSFEANDLRKINWVGNRLVEGIAYNYPAKYKIGQGMDVPSSEASTIFRLAEQYLIRAEARAEQNNFSGAIEDINVIRKRAGLTGTTATSKEQLLVAIEQERRVELFTEGAHRWFDLKRRERADDVLKPIKGTTWQPTDQLYPIPINEIAKSPGIQGHQNPGYN